MKQITDTEREAQRHVIGSQLLAEASIDDLIEPIAQRKEEDEFLTNGIADMLKMALGIIESSPVISNPAPAMTRLIRAQFLRYNKDTIDDRLEAWEISEMENRKMRAKGRG